MTLTRKLVSDAYLQGVSAVEHIAGGYSELDWERPTPCVLWRACELAGHLRCVAEDYHQRLDAVLAGRVPSLPLGEDLARHNAARLDELAPASPVGHVAAFAGLARSYVARATKDVWDRVAYEVGDRRWDVGAHVGVAAIEWHVHAWDLAHALGTDHRPRSGRLLAAAWEHGVPEADTVNPPGWDSVLTVSGRDPNAGRSG